METIDLLQATAQDAPRVSVLYRSCTEYPNDEIVSADIQRGYLYLWERDGALAGAVSLLAGDDDIEHIGLPFERPENPCVLCRLCVSPTLQGRGMGAAMLAASEAKAAQQGYTAMHLLVDVGQQAAQRLYRRAGYRTVGRAELYGSHYLALEKLL